MARLVLRAAALVLLLLIEAAAAAVVVPPSAVGTSLFGPTHGRLTGSAVNNSMLGPARGRPRATVEAVAAFMHKWGVGRCARCGACASARGMVGRAVGAAIAFLI